MEKVQSFLTRFYSHAFEQGIPLLAWPITPTSLKISPAKIYWEQQRNDREKIVRLFEIHYVLDDERELLNGNGQAFSGATEDLMAPYTYEKLNIDIPSDTVDIDHVWKLYEEWLIKWTSAKDLQALIAEPVREQKK